MSPRTLHALLLLLLLLLPDALSLTQPFPQRTPNRHFILSTRPRLTDELSRPDARRHMTAINSVLETFSHTIDTRITTNDPQACNLRAAPWVTLQLTDLEALQLGSLDRTCQSRLVVTEAVSRQELPPDPFHHLTTVIRAAAATFGSAAAPLAETRFLHWPHVHAVQGWDVIRMGQRCTIDTFAAYRVRAQWYLRAVATNHPVDVFVQDGEREYVQQFIHVPSAEALYTIHPAVDHPALVNGSTLLIRSGGKASFSSVAMGDAENPALVEALRLNELAVDQARDAVTASNVAILALPMVMALIPVAFVAELNTFATILYIVLTDVFSALPFLIKGIELTSTGVSTGGEMVVYHVGTTELSVLEAWGAQCHGEDSFRHLGIVFVLTALSVMIMGVLFELFAWRYMNRKGRFAKGPFGEVFRVNRYTVMMRTVDEMDDEGVVEEEEGRRRWRIRWKGRGQREQPVDSVG